jgi:predicted TIM-barrel fold metal-dependent hydrolase
MIDLHRHLWPDGLVEALRSRTAAPCLRNGTLVLADGEWEVDTQTYGLERCLADLDRDGIDLAVVSCPPTFGIELLPAEESEPLLNAYHAGALEAIAASDGRLRAFALERPREGFAGATLGAPALLELDRIAPVLDELERSRSVLFVHPGPSDTPSRTPPWWAAVVGYTAQMQAAYVSWLATGIDRWPDLRVVFAILAGGAPIQLERLRSRGFDVRRALGANLYLDTASYGRHAFELCLASYGGQSLVYGSDAPVIDPAPTLEAIRGFGQAVTDAICVDNPTELLS